MKKIDNKEKIAELLNHIDDDNSIIDFDESGMEKMKEKIPYSMAHISLTLWKISILNQLIGANVGDLKQYSLCTFFIDCHNADMMTMDDLAKIQMFLSEYINPEAEVTWEYGVDDSLKNNQMRLTLVLG